MPATPNLSYCQDFRPFTPFKVTYQVQGDIGETGHCPNSVTPTPLALIHTGPSHHKPIIPAITPSFRRKPEPRKSPGKARAAYRGFWIPAFAGTTVTTVAIA